MFTDALSYPFRNHGWAALAVGAVLVGIGQLIGNGLISILFVSYFFTYFLSVLGSTVTGHDDLPYWPEYDNSLDTYILPAFRYYAAVFVSVAPLIAVYYFIPDLEEESPSLLWIIAAALAMITALAYFPMAVLAISLWGRVSAVLPHVVLPAMVRVGWRYPLLVIGWFAICLPLLITQDLSMKIPYGGWMLSGLVAFFLLLFSARLLGLFYRKHAEAIAWE